MTTSTSTPLLEIGITEPHTAVLVWRGDGPWSHLRGILLGYSRATKLIGVDRAEVPWGEFSGLIAEIRELRGAHPFDVSYSDEARQRLKDAANRIRSYQTARSAIPLTPEDLTRRLRRAGFTRNLTDFQKRNISGLLSLPAGATFSVPGAGKTTEALACFFARRTPGESLLVVAPKNAFASWEEQLRICVPNLDTNFVRLRGGEERISAALSEHPPFMLITYQQLARVHELIARFLSTHATAVFLDESHRIKSGRGAITADAVLSFAHLPTFKLVLSGTPMPQSEADLLPQFEFLFPEVDSRGISAVSLIDPIYVRTTKAELGLPQPQRRIIPLAMHPLQSELYDLLRSESKRQAMRLDYRASRDFRKIGRSVVRLLQFVSNPLLLTDELGASYPDLTRSLIVEGDGPKVLWALQRTRELVARGRKVIVWTSFVANVELIADRLSDLGAEFIHGGVDSGDESESDTREAKIKKFHDDSMVLVANPAAASEGISLHTVCHHAIFLDRSFNAAHYLQAEDRIHRLGLDPNEDTIVEILECRDSIDEIVRMRLNSKVARMADALDDRSLRIEPVPIEDEDYRLEESAGLSSDDIAAVMKHLMKS